MRNGIGFYSDAVSHNLLCNLLSRYTISERGVEKCDEVFFCRSFHIKNLSEH